MENDEVISRKSSFEFRRNEFLRNLRINLVKKNSTASIQQEEMRRSSIKPSTSLLIKPELMYSRHLQSKSIQRQSIIGVPEAPSIDFNQNLKNLIGNKHLSKVKALFMIRELTIASSIPENSITNFHDSLSQSNPEELKASARERFRRKIRLVLIILKLISIHKVSMEKIKKFGNDIKIEASPDENIFDPRFYAKPKEPVFPDEAKKMLRCEPKNRNEDMLRYILISLNFSVPEFSEYPLNIQKMWAQLSFYQEFEPDRVIVRQGHYPTYYYMIISGNVMVIEATSSWTRNKTNTDELVYTPKHTLKRGDCFGDLAIINNSKRTASIKVNGNKPLGMLCVDKDDFFLMQGSRNSKDKLKFLKTNVPLLNKIQYPFDKLERDSRKRQHQQACISIYYRKGAVISENSQLDEWIFVIKSGSCKVIKRIKFNSKTFQVYLDMQKTNREEMTRKLKYLFNLHKDSVYLQVDKEELKLKNLKVQLDIDRHEEKSIYLELSKLQEGDLFGLNDLIFDRELDDYNCPLMLVSEGVECVLIHRDSFLKYVSPPDMFKLRLSSPIYPNDEYFIDKYFNLFVWEDFKKETRENVIEIIDKNKKAAEQ